jgi:hypothetical protein
MGEVYSFLGLNLKDSKENAKNQAVIAAITPEVNKEMDAAATAWKKEHQLLSQIENDPRFKDVKIEEGQGSKGYSRPDGASYDRLLDKIAEIDPTVARNYDNARKAALEATEKLGNKVDQALSTRGDLPEKSDKKSQKDLCCSEL